MNNNIFLSGSCTPTNGIPTFSVNATNRLTPKQIRDIVALTNSINDFNREYVGDAFLKIVEGNIVAFDSKTAQQDMDDYARFHRKEEHREMVKRAKIEYRLVNETELEMGEVGIAEELIPDQSLNVESTASETADEAYYVEEFLELREKLYFKKGVDIFRLLYLARAGDYQAIRRVRALIDECRLKDFFKEFFSSPKYWAGVYKILR